MSKAPAIGSATQVSSSMDRSDQATKELMNSLREYLLFFPPFSGALDANERPRLYYSGEYPDPTISRGERRRRAHKVPVCPLSDFLL